MPPSDEQFESVRHALSAFVAAQLPSAAAPEIGEVGRVTGGLSRENWLFDASWIEDGERREHALIMRRDPVGSVLETDRRTEFAVLRALEQSPIPCPKVFWIDPDGEALGRPSLVMERYDGRNDHFVLEGGVSQLSEAKRLALARRYCDTLAALHLFDWKAAGLGAVLADPGDQGARAAVAEWAAYLERQQPEPVPELVEIQCWLEEHCPRAQASVLVHGDFKPGNSLLSGDDLQVMLDWETAHVGDPIEDIGWVTNPLRAREHTIPGVWQHEDLIRHYQRATGFEVDPEALRFWRVFSNFKTNAILLTGVRSFREGRSDRPWSDDRMLGRILFDLAGI